LHDPGFAWGLHEDLSKRGAVFARLALTATTPMLAYVLLDARITQVGVPGLDALLAVHVVSFFFTVFAVTGIAHAINVIDGLNGLAGVTSLLAALGLAAVAWMVGDTTILVGACVLAASIAGFLGVNWPGGRLFLGDGGAYFIGLLLAVLSVLLVERNAEVSPWLPLVLLAYPIWETLFSMARRRLRGRPAGSADALHLHSLVYRRVVRWTRDGSEAAVVMRNSVAAAVLWTIPTACWVIALAFWDQTLVLQAAALGFIVGYGALYRAIVRFKVPAGLVIRRRAASVAVGPVDADQAAEVR
jgi:UDP-N-acetylmuramyl pentapeptide phosphotransferase/UDP-N-acetylglucosamine-1-phosphate transferase